MANSLESRIRVPRTWLLARSAELRQRVRRVEPDAPRGRGPATVNTAGLALEVENEARRRARRATLDELHFIRAALRRIDRGTLATCENCGGDNGPIGLEIAPHSAGCARCAREN